jgi:hypothetical protein
MLTGSSAFCDGRRVLIDVQNPILLQMLKGNDYTKSCIKQAILAATGRQYGIGPYKSNARGASKTRFEQFVEGLPESDKIIIE